MTWRGYDAHMDAILLTTLDGRKVLVRGDFIAESIVLSGGSEGSRLTQSGSYVAVRESPEQIARVLLAKRV